MGKRSQRRPSQCEKDQLGCMWALISIFDFRLRKTTRRLLSDKRLGSKQAVGVDFPSAGSGYSRSGLNLLTDFDEEWVDIDDGKESKQLTVDVGKTSVKKLLEEEMFSEQRMKKQITSAHAEEPWCDLEHGAHSQKTRKQTKTCKRTCDIQVCDLKDAAILEPHQSSLPNSVEQSSNSLDLAAEMEEFCNQIHKCHEIGLHHENGRDFSDVRKIISCVKHDQFDELNLRVLQEKLSEETEAFINKKFIDGKHLTRDGAIHQSNQFMDALEMLNSNKELFQKLLQDPNSLLVKHIQNLRDSRAKKDEPTKSFSGSNLSEEDTSNSRQCEELVCPKQFQKNKMHNFFRRNSKSQERNPSRESDNPQASNRIVVLKPGIAGMQNSETISLSSSPISHYSLRNNGQSVRAASHFSFREIKRKLKHAIGESRKERHWISMDGKLHTIPCDCQGSGDSGNGIAGGILSRDSPSKTFVDIKRTAKNFVSVKSRDKLGKPKDSGHDIPSYSDPKNIYTTTLADSEQSEPNIYVEAKKHLSEILSIGDWGGDGHLSSSRVPRTLGRLLSLPEYNFSPICSPEGDREHGFVTAQMRVSPSRNFQGVNENMWRFKKENKASRLSPLRQNFEAPPCTDGYKPADELQAFDSNSDILKELLSDTKIHESVSSAVDVLSPKDSPEVNQPPSSSVDIYCSSSLINKKIEELGNVNDVPEHPSPVSVLEPLFIEDAISPKSTISQPAELPMQPLQIHFGEHDSSAQLVAPSDQRFT
ncbi:hypothetical protein HHK36_032866 [Tetracentron sinense]|uniref:DUF3741 domain-containing protein n=1 Tax=Tetracentron sinense TaxID=13715 RepID=A0A834Y8H7_TETSI|nr:hypothetical protein HHK36_032866 [Tetracentron sinense]